jgi:plasmid stability protein
MIKQLTLRRIPDPLEKALRNRAKESGLSLNRVAIELLEQALGVDPSKNKRRDLSGFSGMWTQDNLKEFEQNTEGFNSIDPEIWS